jgi:hypothetical protein
MTDEFQSEKPLNGWWMLSLFRKTTRSVGEERSQAEPGNEVAS